MKKLFSLLLVISLSLSLFAFSSAETTQEVSGDFESMSLAEIYENYFLIGSIFSPGEIPGQHFDFMKKDYNVLTAENAMKPDAMHITELGNFNFNSVDKAIEQILEAGLKVHGHTLAWHNQSPRFLNTGVTKQEAEENLALHINSVAGHFTGRVMSWDVVNEVVNAGSTPEDWRANLRITPWFNAFAQDGGNGEDYIYMAFKLAREAAPDAVLYYNDYNMNVRSKAVSVYHMVKEFNERYAAEGNDRLLIEGIGMQGHYNVNTSIASVEESIELFKSLGVEISITELDVGVPGATSAGLTEQEELIQAIVYAQLFELFKKHSDAVARVTFWGLNDRKSWRSKDFPLLLNADYTPKMAYFAVADPESFLEVHNISGQEVFLRLTGNASYGTPVIDGVIDEIWETAEALPVDQMLQAWQTAHGTARVLWDRENLYVLVEVKDTELCKDSNFAWEQDTVEIYLDELNCKRGSYHPCDKQFSVRFDGRVANFGPNSRIPGFEAAATTSGTNYIIEMKIPFTVITPATGMILGFDAQINDARNGARVGIAKWNDPTNESYLDTSGWGEIMLIGNGEAYTQQESETDDNELKTPADEQNDIPAFATSSGPILGVSFIFIIAAVIILSAIAAVIIILIKRK